MVNQLYTGVEAGGTKFVCAVGTTNPDETIPQVLAFFRKQKIKLGDLAGLGVGSFVPCTSILIPIHLDILERLLNQIGVILI